MQEQNALGHDDDPDLPAEGSPPESAAEAPVESDEPRLSRKGAWIAMAAVALALGLLWAGPDLLEDEGAGLVVFDNPGDVNDADATGKVAPLGFTLKDMNGVDVKLASFKGKIILLNFWATWCPPCKVEIPYLVELQHQYQDDLVILGFSVDDTPAQLRPFAAEYGINYPLLVGNGREDVQDAFGPMWGIPVSVIVGRDGKIVKKHSGIASKEQIEREIQALL
jgi:thiol-disulfide isomerase/thioredoxin